MTRPPQLEGQAAAEAEAARRTATARSAGGMPPQAMLPTQTTLPSPRSNGRGPKRAAPTKRPRRRPDPAPPTNRNRPRSPQGRTGPPRPPGAPPRPVRHVPREVVLRQRRRRRRTIIGVTIFMIVTTLFVGSGVAYVRWRLGQINRLKVPGLTNDAAGQPMNVLLVGSDSRARLTGDAAVQAGKGQFGDSERSDTIMVLHIDPAKQKAAILSIPRDLYLPIAGTGKSDRVNSAFAVGGPERLIATVQDGLGIKINHFAEVDFVGFKEIVDAVGGVTVFVPTSARDAFTELKIGKPGCVKLDGIAALAWVRSRHYEYLSQGKWAEDPRADIGRIERQQDFIRRMMKKAVSSGLTNPLTLNRLIGIGVKNLTIDSEMSTGDITGLARRFSSLDPDSVQTLTLPGEGTFVDDKAVLMLDKAAAQAPLDVVNGKEPAPPPPPPNATPATVAPVDASIEVLNGTGTKGAAGAAAEALKGANFTVSGTGDAYDNFEQTVIRYGDGDKAEAEALAGALKTPPKLTADSTVKPDSLVLVVGADYDGLREGVTAAPPVTTTTVPEPAPAPSDALPPREC